MYKNFQLIAQGIDTTPFLLALAEHEELWNYVDIRTTHPNSPHTDIDDIIVRFNEISYNNLQMLDDYESYWYPAASVLPVSPVIHTLMGQVMGDRIGRCVITRCKPGHKVKPHVDAGSPVSYYQRFHLALQQAPGAKFICGDEVFEPKVGDLFVFDNSKTHSVENDSDADRITMIIDIRTPYFEHIKKTLKTTTTQPLVNKVEYKQGYSYQVESFEQCIPEFQRFVPLHWAELGLTREEVPVDMDWQRYVQMERDNKLHTVTVRHDGKLVGYHVTFVGGHFHYKSTLHGMVDLYFVEQEHRRGWAGIKLLKFAEKTLKDRGVVKIITGTKCHKDNSVLHERLGYTHSDETYMKII